MTFENIAELKSNIGAEFSSTGWFEVTQDLVHQFADATKDHQWIHTDPERAAKETPFGGPIAHGFYSLSLIPMFMETMLHVSSARMGINYGMNKVRFPHHVPVGSQLKCTGKILSVEDNPSGGVKLIVLATVLIRDVTKPACVAELISLLFE
ncbi:MAG: MaoC family dehydratase [Bacteroidota bacterium]